MDSNLKRIMSEYDKLKGQFVITINNNIERLVAVGDDDEDYYYITYNGKTLKWNSCVCRLIPLKGYLRDIDYNEIVRIAKLNHADCFYFNQDGNLDKFLELLDVEISKYSEKDNFLTDFCWDIN